MEEKPDFEALRAKRNAAFIKGMEALALDLDTDVSNRTSNFNPNACYCECGREPRGPCEHKWDGPDWESEDGRASSITCSHCGMTAMSHDLRTGI